VHSDERNLFLHFYLTCLLGPEFSFKLTKSNLFKLALRCDVFRYLYTYKLEEVGQAVCTTFIGQWFLFGIETAARNCTRLHSLHRTSTPYRRQPLNEPPPVTHKSFTVWQMALPSTASLSFIPVLDHLTAGNGLGVTDSFRQVELSLNASVLEGVAEKSDAESEVCISRLRLSCDKTNCNGEHSDCEDVCTPRTYVKNAADASSVTSLVHNTFSWSSQCISPDVCSLALYNSHTTSDECELGDVSSSFSVATFHTPTRNVSESSELFDVIDSSPAANTEERYLYIRKDFTPEILSGSVTEAPTV